MISINKMLLAAATCTLIALSFINPLNAFAQNKKKAGETFRDCPTCPEMVVIPAGNYMMGCPMDDTDCPPEEKPAHHVTIRQFAAGKFDISIAEWTAFVKATNHQSLPGGCAWSPLPMDTSLKPWDLNPAATWNHTGLAQTDKHPVVCITWKDAQDYISWLSKKTGVAYRLLTEAEWEYAARAGTTTAYPWGSTATHENANYGKDSCCGGFAAGRDKWEQTSPVGAFAPNAFGLYDMHGNVLQYVQDCLSVYNSSIPTDGSAYKKDTIIQMEGNSLGMNGKNSCSFHEVRGGDWGDPASMIKSSSRNWTPGPGATLENYSSTGLGLRVARSL